jgi:hypothetical protein
MTHNAFTPVVNAFRFYTDGTEDGSTPAQNQDVNDALTAMLADTIRHLRYRIQESGNDTSGATTDDYGLEVSVGGGGFQAVTAASTFVQAATGSALTDGGATTNRATNGITDGSGVFAAGEQEEANGVIEDHQLTAANFTEHVWAILLVAADFTPATPTTLDFRVTLNGGAPGMTNSVTPRITVTVPASIQAARSMHQFRMRRVA